MAHDFELATIFFLKVKLRMDDSKEGLIKNLFWVLTASMQTFN